jgi:phage FluMu gp28-like protein
MVPQLKKMYEERRLTIPDDPALIMAVNSIQRKYSETNYLKYDATRREEIGHADEFWAQALALYEEPEEMGMAMVDMRFGERRKQLVRGMRGLK